MCESWRFHGWIQVDRLCAATIHQPIPDMPYKLNHFFFKPEFLKRKNIFYLIIIQVVYVGF